MPIDQPQIEESSVQGPQVKESDMPRIAPTEPEKALQTFEVAEGFELQLAAHEPDVNDPIAISFDEKGRAYVVEMRGYSERREEALGQIRLLTDTDGDGIFDQSSVFKGGLKWPTAVLPYKGGVFVGATPHLYYFKDTDGDGVADEEKIVFTGFAEGQLKLNMQSLFNSFRWGPDNRIWGATSAMGGEVVRADQPDAQPVSLRGWDFSFDPEKLDLRQENGFGQNGMTFDALGRRYSCRNSRHVIWVAWERSQLRSNPLYSPPPAFTDIPEEGTLCNVYRISADEPWRIARTKFRLAGLVKGTAEGGGRVSGFFMAATGIHSYWASGLGESARHNLFVGDVGSNLVHRMTVHTPVGQVEPVASRFDPEQKTEFLRSSDNWFRPVSFATGPDGSLYIADMYREVIEHPWSIPENIKKHLDLNSGFQRGRIYRVRAEGAPLSAVRDLSGASLEELRECAESDNDWQQTTARRLLYEKGHPVAAKPAVAPFPANLSASELLLDDLPAAVEDRWMRAAFLNSVRTAEDVSRAWEAAAAYSQGPLHAELAKIAGRLGHEELIGQMATSLAELGLSPATIEILSKLQEGFRIRGASWEAFVASPAAEVLLQAARAAAGDRKAEMEKRVVAVQVLGLLPHAEDVAFLKELLTGDEGGKMEVPLVDAISDLPWLVAKMGSLGDDAKSRLANRVLAEPTAGLLLLQALEDRKVVLEKLPATLVQGLRQHSDPQVAQRAADILPAVVTRESVVEKYLPTLEMPGDRARGKLVFQQACAVCHVSHEGDGIALGPAISTFAAAGRDSLLTNILHPNKEVAAQYQAYLISREGEADLLGMILSETATEMTIRMPGGVDQTFARSKVTGMKALGQSLMPEGLENAVSLEDMPHLMEYLLSPENDAK